MFTNAFSDPVLTKCPIYIYSGIRLKPGDPLIRKILVHTKTGKNQK